MRMMNTGAQNSVAEPDSFRSSWQALLQALGGQAGQASTTESDSSAIKSETSLDTQDSTPASSPISLATSSAIRTSAQLKASALLSSGMLAPGSVGSVREALAQKFSPTVDSAHDAACEKGVAEEKSDAAESSNSAAAAHAKARKAERLSAPASGTSIPSITAPQAIAIDSPLATQPDRSARRSNSVAHSPLNSGSAGIAEAETPHPPRMVTAAHGAASAEGNGASTTAVPSLETDGPITIGSQAATQDFPVSSASAQHEVVTSGMGGFTAEGAPMEARPANPVMEGSGSNNIPSAVSGTAGSESNHSGAAARGTGRAGSSSRSGHTVEAIPDRNMAHGAHGGAVVLHGELASMRPEAANVQDAMNSAWVRDPAASAVGQRSTGPAQSPSANATGSAVKDTFAAIDSDRSTPLTTWTHAGANRAEAGYLDPALGWVGVRAETSGSALHASVVPGSAEAAQALSGHLSGLNTYMAGQHGQAATVTMAAPEGGQVNSGWGAGQNMNGGGGQDQGSGRQAAPGESAGAAAGPQEQTADTSSSPASAATSANPALADGSHGGRYISVMA